jgi:hypothetical protein
MGRQLAMAAGLFLLISGTIAPKASLAWPWESCQQQWEKAWDKCDTDARHPSAFGHFNQCSPLPEKYRPECQPEDKYLTEYRGGYQEHLRVQAARQEMSRARQERLQSVRIDGYSYDAQVGTLLLYANVANLHSSETLRSISLQCRLIGNGSIELYNGQVSAKPNIISRRWAEVQLWFDVQQRWNRMGLPPLHGKNEKRESLALTHEIYSLVAECELTDAGYLYFE